MKKEGLLCGVRGPEERRGGDTDTVIMTKIILFKITRATEIGGTQPVSGVLRSCHWQSSNGPQSRGSRRPGCHFLSSVPRAQDPKASGLQEGGSRSPLPGPRSPQLWAGSPRCTAALRQFRKQTAGVGRCAWRHSLSWGPTHQTQRSWPDGINTAVYTEHPCSRGRGVHDAAVIGAHAAQELGLPGPLDPANISKQAGSSSMKPCDLPALSFPEVLKSLLKEQAAHGRPGGAARLAGPTPWPPRPQRRLTSFWQTWLVCRAPRPSVYQKNVKRLKL